MKIPDITIAVDGYSSTGKSSFARLVARQFGFLYLDSGAVYRGVTLFASEHGYISGDGRVSDALKEALVGLDLRFSKDGKTCIGDRCVEEDIRSMAVSSLVSPVAAVPYVRDFVDARLHELASGGGVVMDGRDIGTTVFPDAELKVFVTASPEVRAQRRFDELKGKGMRADYEEILKNVKERDYIDSHREVSPLRKADDAIELDNSHLTIAQQKAWLLEKYKGAAAE